VREEDCEYHVHEEDERAGAREKPQYEHDWRYDLADIDRVRKPARQAEPRDHRRQEPDPALQLRDAVQ
jgi:hypothetical protein